MDKTEQVVQSTLAMRVKQWVSETSSYEGCVYLAVDKNGNSFARIYNHKYVSDRQLVDRLKQLVEIWDAQLKENVE